jgi:hypothetical protein
MFNDRPPWTSPLPLHLQDLGTSRWQLGYEIYVGTFA